MADQKSARVALTHLRSWRAYRARTLEQLAEDASMSKMAVQRLESLQARANPITVFKLAKALNIPRQALLEYEPEEFLEQPDTQVAA